MRVFLAASAILAAVLVARPLLTGQTSSQAIPKANPLLTGPAPASDEEVKFEPAQVVSTVEPDYPLKTVNPGTVVLEVVVSPSGAIDEIKPTRSAAGFMDACLSAVKQWRFQPATLNGKPIRSSVTVAFSFSQTPLWKPGP